MHVWPDVYAFKDKNSGKDQGEAIAQKEENRQVDKDISTERRVLVYMWLLL